MTTTDDLIDIEVPIVILFRAPADQDRDDLDQFVDAVMEHGTVRDVFATAIDGADLEPLAYDGFAIPHLTRVVPRTGVLVLPADLADRLTPETIHALASAGITDPLIHRNLLGPSEVHRPNPSALSGGPPPLPWPAIARAIAIAVIVLAVLAGTAAMGYLVGMRTDTPEHERTRRAVCQVLDQLGADASTADQAEPCLDTPAGS